VHDRWRLQHLLAAERLGAVVMMVLMLLLAARTAASSVRFADQLAAMARAADDSSAGRALRQGSDRVSWEDTKGGAQVVVLERMDAAICGPQPCWLLTSAAVGWASTKLLDISEMPALPGGKNSHMLPLLPVVLVPGTRKLERLHCYDWCSETPPTSPTSPPCLGRTNSGATLELPFSPT
jgi:hypothetical protein